MSSFFGMLDGRWTDSWVVDRTLFEHFSGGSCSCCGVAHVRVGELMVNCSDIETDDGRQERESPWPAAMSEEVWAGRVKLRIAMKEEMPLYKQFWENDGEGFSTWWTRLQTHEQQLILSMPVAEVPMTLNGKYDLRGAYCVVMCAVNEQVRNFGKTGIKGDGRSAAELVFEESLEVDRGGYVGKGFGEDNQAFFDMCQQMGGPRLLPSKPRGGREEAGGRVDPAETANSPRSIANPAAVNDVSADDSEGKVGQSFRADRRLIRLIAFRYMLDKAIRKYRASVVGEEGVESSPPPPTAVAATEA